METRGNSTARANLEKDIRDEAPLNLLGVDQVLTILQRLAVPSIVAFGMTCSRFHELANLDTLWVLICRRDWGGRVVDAWSKFSHCKVGWKQLYCRMLFLSAAAWQRLRQGDVVPPPRASHAMNVVSGKITVFGGGCNGGRHLDDTWVASLPEDMLDDVTWQQASIGIPSGRFGQSSIVVGDVLVLFGGINDRGIRQSDTWINKGIRVASALEMSSWQHLEVAQSPPPRGAHAGCYAGDMKVVIFGGIGADGIRLQDTWILDLSEVPTSWHEVIAIESPSARSGHTLTWIGGKHMILFGGRGTKFEVLNDVWLLDMEGDYPIWVELKASELQAHNLPAPRAGHSASLIFGGRILIFGGEDAKRSRKGDVWVLDPSVGLQARRGTPYTSPSQRYTSSSEKKFARKFWKRLKQRGKPPNRRSFHGACSLDSSHAILIFGGMVSPEGAFGLGFDDELYMLQLVP